jgi:hypothetical protein
VTKKHEENQVKAVKNRHKKPEITVLAFQAIVCILHRKSTLPMKGLLLNAFYDAMQYNIGWVITYIFIFLMFIELIYVMAKYLGPRSEK